MSPNSESSESWTPSLALLAFALLGSALLGCGSPQRAPVATAQAVVETEASSGPTVIEGQEALAFALESLGACPELPPAAWVESATREEVGTYVAAWREGDHVFLEQSWRTSGVEGGTTTEVIRVAQTDCSFAEVGWSSFDGSYCGEVRGAENLSAIEAAAMLRSEVMREAEPAHGAMQLSLSLSPGVARVYGALDTDFGFGYRFCSEVSVSQPLYRVQPWLSGPPAAAPRLYDPSRDLYCANVDAPTHLVSRDEMELWTAPIRGRNGGFAVAQYDRATDSHRWLFWSRFSVNATTASWGPVRDDLVVAYGRSQHPAYQAEIGADGFFVLDLRSGSAHRLHIGDMQTNDAFFDAEGPDEALRAVDAQWTRDGLDYLTTDGTRRRLSYGQIRSWLVELSEGAEDVVWVPAMDAEACSPYGRDDAEAQ